MADIPIDEGIPDPTPEQQLEIDRVKVERVTIACKALSLDELFELKTAVIKQGEWLDRKLDIINEELKGRW